jgi:hypothetical protein
LRGFLPNRLIKKKSLTGQSLWPPHRQRIDHYFVSIAALTIGKSPQEIQPMVMSKQNKAEITTIGNVVRGWPTLTGGCGGGQCPAPFARPVFETLHSADTTPDKPLIPLLLGSLS